MGQPIARSARRLWRNSSISGVLNRIRAYLWGSTCSKSRDTAAFQPIPPAHELLKTASDTLQNPNNHKRERGRCTPFQDLYGILVNGNITAYINEAGVVVASYSHDAFGGTIAQTGLMADAFPHRFSTKYIDPETGLY